MASTPGISLGPYEVLELLGSGGMGEVYRARDHRLGRDVAIKLLSAQGTPSPDRLRRFETEARAVASLSHPNVVTIFDVGTHEGVPYLVLELLDGYTLREVLQRQTPTLREAVAWALEIARGLAAAHERGVVHRDLKPENVLLTTEGRIKVLDFGLAKLREGASPRRSGEAATETRPGRVLGTAGYMAPEQVRGEVADARGDVFSLGAVLYEMVTCRCPFHRKSNAEALVAVLRDDPPPLSSLNAAVPPGLESVTSRCLAKDRTRRFASAAEVAAALETVLVSLGSGPQRLTPPPEPRGPYPGLASFTEEDAERFVGREAEVEALWTKLRRERLLALIGPSGAGKTSFVRAGLVPSRPTGWGAIVVTPGRTPMRALGQALVGLLPPDPETLRQLLAFDDEDVALDLVRRWRQGHAEAAFVVDQFEELFTLNPPDVQGRFAGLLGRLSAEADVHVLLSMRDDFLIRCHEHKSLASVFQSLTPIVALGGDDLRRALVEPARREGFAFEDEALVAEMLHLVEGTRGALPLLAFAVSRLWEKRDRERSLLTRQAYEEIGGVAGALARHADETLERIGPEREPVVRELFRNLVTAHSTRAVADREELLSVLPDREAGSQVLDQLVDARLLTSYEVQDEVGRDDEGHETQRRHRIEIVHESLLRAWPRLMRWQAQDEEGAVLRDQLKQAAHLWEGKGRPDDLLWTGTSEREFELWQTRYPGTLTALESDFARAMVERARRWGRRRHAAISMLVAGLVAVAVVVGGLWRRSVAQEQRAEAAGLFSLAQQRLDEHPTEALAYAMASLERADGLPVRQLALEALRRGPKELRLPTGQGLLEFSPDGRWLAAGRPDGGWALWPSAGGPPTPLEGSHEPLGRIGCWTRFSSNGDRILGHMGQARDVLGIWSVPDGRLLRSLPTGGDTVFLGFSPDGTRVLTAVARLRGERGELEWRAWPSEGGEPALMGRVNVAFDTLYVWPDVDPSWSRVIWADGRVARVAPLEGGRLNASASASLEHAATVSWVAFGQGGRRAVTTSDQGNRIDIWSLEHQPPEPLHSLLAPAGLGGFAASLDAAGSRLVGGQGVLWDLAAPPDFEPLPVQGCGFGRFVPPRDRWLATPCGFVSLWPLDRNYPHILRGHRRSVSELAFTPDGRWLVSGSADNSLRLWSMWPGVGARSRVLQPPRAVGYVFALSMAPDGSFVSAANSSSEVMIVPLDGGPVRRLGVIPDDLVAATAVGPGRHLVAAGSAATMRKQGLVYVWDPATGDRRVLDAGDGAGVTWLEFAGEDRLLVGSAPSRRRLWDLGQSPPRVIEDMDLSAMGLGGHVEWGLHDEHGGLYALLLSKGSRLWIRDLRTGATQDVAWVNEGSGCEVQVDPSGQVVLSRNPRGVMGVASTRGGGPHLLLRHPGSGLLAISPDGQWIASGGDDGTIRLWPMPDLSTPPLHTLPRQVLLAKLRSATNLRAVRDRGSATGWRIEAGPFPGWETVPEW